MTSINISAALGDSKEFTILLGFSPDPETGSLIFTVKHRYEDNDEDAVFQKSSGAGIELEGNKARVRILREDTVDLNEGTLYAEILWQDTATLLSEPIASGQLKLRPRLTRGQQTAVPVFTTEAPLPFGPGSGADLPDWLLALDSLSINPAGELVIVKDGVTRKTPMFEI